MRVDADYNTIPLASQEVSDFNSSSANLTSSFSHGMSNNISNNCSTHGAGSRGSSQHSLNDRQEPSTSTIGPLAFAVTHQSSQLPLVGTFQGGTRTFKRPSILPKRIDTHSKPYTCRAGRSKSFGSIKDRDRYGEQIHLKERPYLCAGVGCKHAVLKVAFYHKDKLAEHLKRSGHVAAELGEQ